MTTPSMILIGCVATKAPHACQARDLYTSPLFKKRRAYAEASGLPWAILTAHRSGIFDPFEVVEPYDYTLDQHTDDPRSAWPNRLMWQVRVKVRLERYLKQERGQFCDRLSPGQVIEVHAGAPYVEALRKALASKWDDQWHTVTITHPVEGLQIGEQLAFYKEFA
jgi:hypothetical protein